MTALPNRHLERARKVLGTNHRPGYTAPDSHIYTHQWLWDSCFTAIGLAQYNPHLAMAEINSLLKAQWKNGMVPHMIFSDKTSYWLGPGFWKPHRSPSAPQGIQTSGITQPPLLSIAVIEIADKLPAPEAKLFLKQAYPALLAYHEWLYRERDPQQTGLIVLLHSWESGLDNSPPWMETLNKIPNPFWLATFFRLKLGGLISHLRSDIQVIPEHQRLKQTDAIKLVYRAILLRNNRYDSLAQIKSSWWLIEDVGFNSIFIAANRALFDIATLLGEDLPAQLSFRMNQTERAIEELWDDETSQYYSRNYRTKKLIKVPSIASLLPLYSGVINKNRAHRLVNLLNDPKKYSTNFSVPSVPIDSEYFDQHIYWQGPTWVNTNWLLIQGLRTYGFNHEASQIKNSTQKMIEQHGFYEYFSPLSGKGYGTKDFSWTAALYLHLATQTV